MSAHVVLYQFLNLSIPRFRTVLSWRRFFAQVFKVSSIFFKCFLASNWTCSNISILPSSMGTLVDKFGFNRKYTDLGSMSLRTVSIAKNKRSWRNFKVLKLLSETFLTVSFNKICYYSSELLYIFTTAELHWSSLSKRELSFMFS